MKQRHGDRLTATDAAFLSMEAPTQPMHVAGLFIFEPADDEPFDFGRFVRLVRSRLHLVPRYRQRLRWTPMHLAAPVWVDDAAFDIAYHVRHAALAQPGTMAELMAYGARILSRPLDRDRPLWELYVIEGLEDGHFAILGKTHHAMVDGIAGMDIASVMLDLSGEDTGEIPEPEPWSPEPTPPDLELAWSAVRELLTSPAAAAGAARRTARAPVRLARDAVEIGQGLLDSATRLLRPAPRSPLNGPPGRSRRFAVQRLSLEDVKRIKNTYGTTVNDVVLALTADATGRFLRHRGDRTDGLWLRAMVPVSVRTDDDSHALGNRVTSVFVDLPVFELDPAERLEICHAAMQDVKDRHQAAGADFLLNLGSFAPATIHAMASRLVSGGRIFNFVVTNVPGPQIPIYCLGARLLGTFPFIPLAGTQRYAVGVTSIDGWLNFGFTADYDSLSDIEDMTGCLRDALEDLTRSADAAKTHHEMATTSRPTGGGTVSDSTDRVDQA